MTSTPFTGDPEAIRRLLGSGLTLIDEPAMSLAVHQVYCGPDADHDEPNEKDRQQAKSLMQSLQEALSALYPA